MVMDPALPGLVGIVFCILLIGLGLRRLRQPHVVAYLAAGLAIGPHGFDLVHDEHVLLRAGEAGVILLLFFVGMEVSIPRLVQGWRIAIVGTLLQIALSVAATVGLGALFGWPLARAVLFGFAISLSSTAVVLSLLRARDLLPTEAGQDALGILLVQDVAIIPMLIVIGLLGGGPGSPQVWAQQVVGGAAVVALLVVIGRHEGIRLPLGETIRGDHELQVFAAFLICFGMALITALVGLSTALGAFVGGVVVASARETEWIHRSLEPLRVLFLALFFASVGALLDLDFIGRHWIVILVLVAAVLVTNTLINSILLRVLGRAWRTAFFVGALLAQIGEFSFVLAAVGKETGVITEFSYRVVLSVIALTLAVSPAWAAGFGRLIRPSGPLP